MTSFSLILKVSYTHPPREEKRMKGPILLNDASIPIFFLFFITHKILRNIHSSYSLGIGLSSRRFYSFSSSQNIIDQIDNI